MRTQVWFAIFLWRKEERQLQCHHHFSKLKMKKKNQEDVSIQDIEEYFKLNSEEDRVRERVDILSCSRQKFGVCPDIYFQQRKRWSRPWTRQTDKKRTITVSLKKEVEEAIPFARILKGLKVPYKMEEGEGHVPGVPHAQDHLTAAREKVTWYLRHGHVSGQHARRGQDVEDFQWEVVNVRHRVWQQSCAASGQHGDDFP